MSLVPGLAAKDHRRFLGSCVFHLLASCSILLSQTLLSRPDGDLLPAAQVLDLPSWKLLCPALFTGCCFSQTSCRRYLQQQVLHIELQELLRSSNGCLEACGNDLLYDLALQRNGYAAGQTVLAAVQLHMSV